MKNKIYLIYDNNCPFCVHVAHILEHLICVDGLKTIPNTSSRALKIHRSLTKRKIAMDVHAVVVDGGKTRVFTGADAVAKVVSSKSDFYFLWKIHSFFPYLFRLIYYVSKKIRKIIYNLSI